MNDVKGEEDPEVARAHALQASGILQSRLDPRIVAREAGLAEELAKLPVAPAKRLRRLYAVMDEISTAVTPFSACSAGCSACCHYNVSVFPIEAKYIEDWTGHRRLRTPLPPADFHGMSCPFLEKGRCSIYAVRPMACRKHFMLTRTAYWCATERCREGEQFTLLGFSAADAAFTAIIGADGRGKPKDIREWFGHRNEPG